MIDTALIVACAGGIVRYHNNNDHLSCISKGKGGDGKDLREMLFLVPKNLEDQVLEAFLLDSSMTATCTIPIVTV